MNKEWRTHTTPEEKYRHDPHYHALVNMMESFIEKAEFTPSELREAALYAAIRVDLRRASPPIFPFERDY